MDLAINMELGMRNQHQIQQHNKTLIPASVHAIQFPASLLSSIWSLSNNFHKQGKHPPLYCSNCGGNCLPNSRDKCVAKGKLCNNCGLMNHFAITCQKQKKLQPQNPKKRTVNTVVEEPQPQKFVELLSVFETLRIRLQQRGGQNSRSHPKRYCKNRNSEHADLNRQYLDYCCRLGERM